MEYIGDASLKLAMIHAQSRFARDEILNSLRSALRGSLHEQ